MQTDFINSFAAAVQKWPVKKAGIRAITSHHICCCCITL